LSPGSRRGSPTIVPAVLVAVLLDRLRDHRVVDDWEHLLQVLLEQPVVQNLVAVV